MFLGPVNIFTIYEPKERRIVSQNVQDKIVNHLVARYILYPALLPCLLSINVASRKDMGTSKGLELASNFHRICKIKYKRYYILKADVSKFFASIDHDILKEKLKRKINDVEALKIVFDIIDSNSDGLFIGSMTSQILAIFYLNDLDHFIKETLSQVNTQENTLYDFIYNLIFFISLEESTEDTRNGKVMTIEETKERLMQEYEHLNF